MEMHPLRDLGLGLQLPGWMLNPQGKERCGVSEKKKLAALHSGSRELCRWQGWQSRALTDGYSPLAPEQGKQSRSGDSDQVQP